MDLTQARIVSILSIGLGTVIMGMLPSCFTGRGRQRHPLLLSSLLCFGAGVLLSTSLIHILPEVRKGLPRYKEYTELFFCGGFFLLYVTDEIMHCFYESAHAHGHSHTASERRHSEGMRFSYGSTERDPLVSRRQPPYNPALYKSRSDSELLVDDYPPSQVCHVSHQEPCNYGPVVSLGLLVALTVHSVFEGLVVGLEDSATKVFLLLGAVASHKLVVSFCLGAELASNPQNSRCKNFVGILILALGSVGGILVGIFISKLPEGGGMDLIVPILQGLAGGTLLYVTVSEILPRERARWHKEHQHKIAGVAQFISMTIGFAIMTLLNHYLDADE